MSIKYAEGRKAWGECERCGLRFLLNDLINDGYKQDLLVCQPCWDMDHPQERLPDVVDPITLYEPTGDMDVAQSRDEFLVVDGIQYGGERLAQKTIFVSPAAVDRTRITIDETVNLTGSLSFRAGFTGDSFPPAEEAEISYVMALTATPVGDLPFSWRPEGDGDAPHVVGDVTLTQAGDSAEISWGNTDPKDLYLTVWAALYYPSIREVHTYARAQARLILDIFDNTFSNFDFMVIRYNWDPAKGTDLDTRTAVINTGDGADGADVGWSRNNFIYSDGSLLLLEWGGDNTSSTGPEAVLVYAGNMDSAFPDSDVDVRLRGNWYGPRLTGNVDITITTYLGGTMSTFATDFVNNGGSLVREIVVSANVISNVSDDVDGSDVGVMTYNTTTRNASITISEPPQ